MKVHTAFELEYTVTDSNQTIVTAIVVAAGNATRMGGSKQFVPLLGIPVIARTLMAFQACDGIHHLVVVAKEEDIPDIQTLAEQYGIEKLYAIVAGGRERQDSVQNGLAAVPPETQYVAIHDGARPLITPDAIKLAVDAAKEHGAGAIGVSVKDTIKKVGPKGNILETVERSNLVAMQTPQVFDVVIYQKAVQYVTEHCCMVTDDCQMCELAGFPVYVVDGDYRNIKITTPEDVVIAEAFLQEGKAND